MKSLNEIRKEATAGTATTMSMFGRSIDWIGRNDFGDVEEYDTFHSEGNAYYAEFYGYDSFGNRIAATNALGAVTSSAYDAANRIAESSGAVYPVRYGYDTEGRRTGLSTTRNGNEWDATGWTFDPATGFCTVKTYADGSTVTYSYALTLSNGVTFTRSLTRGAYLRHLVTGVSSAVDGVPVEGLAYSYDALGRPTGRNGGRCGV